MSTRGSPPPVATPTGTSRLPAGLAGPPPAPSRSRAARLRGPLLGAAAAAGLALALRLRDPHASGSWGVCPWLLLTGYYCPGCGGLRAVNDLTHGDLAAAASSNLLVVAMLPVLVLGWLLWVGRAWSGPAVPVRANAAAPERGRRGGWGRPDPSRWLIALFAAAMVAYAVLRNLPAGAWLAP